MYKKLTILFLSLLLFTAGFNQTYANTSTLSSEDIKTLADYILKNYAGSEVTEEELYTAAMKGMFSALDDYSQFFTEEEFNEFIQSLSGSIDGIGIQVIEENEQLKISNVIKNTPAEKANFKVGDIIVKINNESVDGLSSDEVLNKIKGKKGTSLTITVQRAGKQLTLKVTRAQITIASVYPKTFKELGITFDASVLNQTQYVAITSVNETTSKEFSKALNQAKKEHKNYLILDLRNNYGGYLEETIKICNKLIPKGPIMYTVKKDGTEDVKNSTLDQMPFKNILVLTNENTASAAEVLSSAIKESNAGITIGETTFGKGVVQNINDYKDYAYKLTEEEYLSRNKNKIHGVGVKPTIEVIVPHYLPDGKNRYSVGMKEANVKSIETILQYLGYLHVKPDNTYDEATSKAVKAFQKNTGLYAYGVCDYSTQKSLNETLQKSLQKTDPPLKTALDYIKNHQK